MTKRRILFLNHGAVSGGSETEFMRLLRHFHALQGYEVYGAYPEGPLAPAWDKLCASRCVYKGRLPRLPRLRTYVGQVVYGARYLPGLAVFLARKKIDLLVINSSVPLGAILLAAASRRPTVIIVREFVFPEWLSTGLLRLIDLVARRVITVSDALKLDIERKTGSRKVTRIFGGIDVGTFEYSPPRETVRRVGAVGSINPLKGQIDLVRAVSRTDLCRTHPEIDYSLIGPMPGALAGYLATIRHELETAGLEERFTLTGEVFDMPLRYRELDLVVVPSRSEGQSLVVLEAWASGVPVIATRSGGPADMIEDGVNGLLVPPADPLALADALRRLIEDASLRRRLSEAGRQTVEKRFDARESDRAVQGVVDEILAYR